MEVLKIKFGMNENNIDAHGIRLYGSIDNKTKQFTGISELIPDPDVLPMIQHKRVTLWFTFENIRPYTAVMDLINELEIGLKQRAYTIIASSLNDLVDTTSGEYKGRPESNFPVPYKTRGYNAARGFSITAEKVDEEMKFSIIEIEKIKEFAVKFGYIVYGRYLSNTEMAALDTEQSP
jgi:hypothetical protein